MMSEQTVIKGKKMTKIDIENIISENSIIWSEFQQRMMFDPGYFIFLKLGDQSQELVRLLTNNTILNDYGEYDNTDVVISSGWSKQKGVGKSSVGITLKLLFDKQIMKQDFTVDEVFFTIVDKLQYLKANAGLLNNRFFVLDEMIDLVGHSSRADRARMARLDTTTRIRGFSNAYVSPTGHGWFGCDYRIAVVAKDIKNKLNICRFETSSGSQLGALYVKIPPKKIWKDYQKKKIKFTSDLESGRIVEFKFMEAFEALEKEWGINDIFLNEQKFYTEMAAFKIDGGKGVKPIKPRTILTESKIQSMLLMWNRELTVDEKKTAASWIRLKLEKNFKGGD